MQEHVKILDKSFAISLHKATVIHSDKFTETSGGYSTLYTSVIFRSEETDEDWPITISKLNPTLYPSQKVMLIVVNQTIIGFIDEKTNSYYYTTKELGATLKLGLPLFALILFCVLATAGAILLSNKSNIPELIIIAFIAFWAIYFVQKPILNIVARKAINKHLS